ncbi:hypothetical protein DFJ77DRAFT_90112 [Powellomyces hirtus]|nr:hypothetical protein DFJ77DRAFT_90112 [Powellomyces hirtus]
MRGQVRWKVAIFIVGRLGGGLKCEALPLLLWCAMWCGECTVCVAQMLEHTFWTAHTELQKGELTPVVVFRTRQDQSFSLFYACGNQRDIHGSTSICNADRARTCTMDATKTSTCKTLPQISCHAVHHGVALHTVLFVFDFLELTWYLHLREPTTMSCTPAA